MVRGTGHGQRMPQRPAEDAEQLAARGCSQRALHSIAHVLPHVVSRNHGAHLGGGERSDAAANGALPQRLRGEHFISPAHGARGGGR